MEMAMETQTPPPQFVCPISLTRMQDPVTAPSGITYDRGAIERWLAAGHDTCPVTGRGPLSLADLTPNLTLRRLILSWPKSSNHRHLTAPAQSDSQSQHDDDADVDGGPAGLAKLVEKVMIVTVPAADVLREVAAGAEADAMARRRMVQGGVLIPRVLRLFVSACATEAEKKTRFSPGGVEAACLAVLDALGVSADEIRPLLPAEPGLLDALTHVLVTLEHDTGELATSTTRERAVRLLESTTEASTPALLDRLRPDLFRALAALLRDHRRVPRATTRATLQTILNACAGSSRNLRLAAEAGVAHEAIELELSLGGTATSRGTTKLVMAVLSVLCGGSAEARAAVAGHAAGIALVAKRVLLRGSSSAAGDAAAVRVLASVCGRGASSETVREMARVGAVGKLCCVLQAECQDPGIKETARRVLRMHAGDWAGSPCVSAYLLSRYL